MPGSAAQTYTLVRDPNDARSFWAGGADSSGAPAVWVSHDVGQTWTELVVPIATPLRVADVTALAIQAHSGRVVAGIDGFGRFGLAGEIRFSDDGGAHWTQANVTPQSWPAGNAIVFSSQSDSIAFASGNGTLGVLRSLDGGMTWTQEVIADNADFFTLALAPGRDEQGERIFGAGTGTIQVSDDGGTTWTESDRGLSLLGVVGIAEDGRDSGGLYAQNGGGGLVRSEKDGEYWASIDPVAGTFETFDFAVDPVASTHPLYALTSLNGVNGVSRSDDRGRDWSTLAAPLPPVVFQEQMLADPSRAGTLDLFVSSTAPFNSILQTKDFGATWRSAAIGVAGDFAAVPLPLAADPNHPGVLYAAMGSGLWKSSDFGVSWNLVPQLPLGAAGIAGLAVTSGPSGAVYVVAGADDGTFSLQKSHDGGASWSTASSAFGASPYLISTDGGGELFAYQWIYDSCVDQSVLESRDGARSWSLVDGSVESKFNSGDCIFVLPTAHHLFLSDAFGTWLTFGKNLGSEGYGMDFEPPRSGLPKSPAWTDPRERGTASRPAWNRRFTRNP